MKRRLILVLPILLALLFSGCETTQTDENTNNNIENTKPEPDPEPEITTTLTIKNASSYTLKDIKWNDVYFEKDDSGIEAGSFVKKNVEEGFGYIYFSFYPKDSNRLMECYTSEPIDIAQGDNSSFTFTNNTVVVQKSNTQNKNAIDNIQFPTNATLNITFNERNVEKNDVINLGELILNTSYSFDFVMENAGSDVLKLVGNNPVVASNDNITISKQPTVSNIDSTSNQQFTVLCNAKQAGSFSSAISISSNDQTSPYTFTVEYEAVEPKADLSIRYNETTINNEGTINFGEVPLEKNKVININITNSGTKKLTLTGSPAIQFLEETSCFEIVSQPIPEISIGDTSSFSIKYTPTKEGEEFATIKILSDDFDTPTTYIYLTGTGEKVYPTFNLYAKKSTTQTLINESDILDIYEPIRKDQSDIYIFTIKNTNEIMDLRISVNTDKKTDKISIGEYSEVIPSNSTGEIKIHFNPNEEVGTFSEVINIVSNCETEKFSFTIQFDSRDFGNEALLKDWNYSSYDIKVSPEITSDEKNYTITCDSTLTSLSFTKSDFKVSDYASVYLDEKLLDSTGTKILISDEKKIVVKVVSEDGITENSYTFTVDSVENYNSTDLSSLMLKTSAEKEFEIATILKSKDYHSPTDEFYLKPIPVNPNAKVYIIEGNNESGSLIGNNEYSGLLNIKTISDKKVTVKVVSESGLYSKIYNYINPPMEALLKKWDYSDYDIKLSSGISSTVKSYTITCDSTLTSLSFTKNDFEVSEFASIYIDDILLDSSSTSISIYDEKEIVVKIVSGDNFAENSYTFTVDSIENYNSTDLSSLMLKTSAEKEFEIAEILNLKDYHSPTDKFYLKPIPANPNAKVYIIEGNNEAGSLMENNKYSSLLDIRTISDKKVTVKVVSESGLCSQIYNYINPPMEALLKDWDLPYDIKLSSGISSAEKNYTITCDSALTSLSFTKSDFEVSEFASIYVDDELIDSGSTSVSIYDGRSFVVKVVSGDRLVENSYTFTVDSIENYNNAKLSSLTLKTSTGEEVAVPLNSDNFHSPANNFYLKPVLVNPNAKVYIAGSLVENNIYSALLDIRTVPDKKITVKVISESGFYYQEYNIYPPSEAFLKNWDWMKSDWLSKITEVSPIISSAEKNYTIVYESFTGLDLEFKKKYFEVSDGASIYINGQELLDSGYIDCDLDDGEYFVIKIISEDGLTENNYTFTVIRE